MKDYLLLFRKMDLDNSTISKEEMASLSKKWKNWTENIASQGKLTSNGSRLAMEGKVLKPGGVITDGPFVEIKEKLGGFIVVRAESLDEATTLAHGCPVLDGNGSVEIRSVY